MLAVNNLQLCKYETKRAFHLNFNNTFISYILIKRDG